MNAHVDTGSCLPFTVEYELDGLARGLTSWRGTARFRSWNIFPYGWWEEADGSLVIFDRRYRPLCRKGPDGYVEILRPSDRISYIKQSHIYRLSEHPADNPVMKRRIYGIVHRLGLLPELSRRQQLEVAKLNRKRAHWQTVWRNRALMGCSVDV